MRKNVKSIFKIFLRDVKTIATNKAALVIFVGLMFIPSLYAWVNIGANWDPYANTGNIPIAVVNNDNGAVIDGEYVNVGDEIIDQLKEDDGMDWVITSDFEAGYGLHMADYYALIEIPDDFSSDLATFTTATVIRPEIIYRSNEKANAIATKITDVAKTHLTDSIQSRLIQVATGKVFGYLNDLGGTLESDKNQLFHLISVLDDSTEYLSQTSNLIIDQIDQLEDLEDNLNRTSTNLAQIDAALGHFAKIGNASNQYLRASAAQKSSLANRLNSDMLGFQSDLTTLNLAVENYHLAQNSAPANNLDDQIGTITVASTNLIQDIFNLNTDLDLFHLYQPIGAHDQTANQFDQLAGDLTAINQALANQDGLDQAVMTTLEDANDLVTSYNQTTRPLTDSLVGGGAVLPFANTLSDTRMTNSMLQSLSAIGSNGVANTIADLSSSNQLIQEYRDSLEDIQTALDGFDEASFDKVVNIMKTNPDTIADFLANPINVETEDIYGDYPFGVGLTPFYTVLSIWVGVLLMMALVTTKVKPLPATGKPKFYVGHFGRMGLIIAMSLIQTTIVLFGDVFLLQVPTGSRMLFFGAGYFTSLTFTIIIYTLVSLFGNVGKGICVVVMVFQIAGSGGIYPIQTNPEIFGVLHPFWPFTYAIDLLRQAIAIPNGIKVAGDFRMLGGFMAIFMVLGLFKKLFYPLTNWLDSEFHRANF